MRFIKSSPVIIDCCHTSSSAEKEKQCKWNKCDAIGIVAMESMDASAADEATVETVDDGYYTEKEFNEQYGQADSGSLWQCEWLH